MAFPSGYTGYDTITLSTPSGSLTSFPFAMNANELSADWWTNVKSDGGDVQVYDEAGNRLAVHLHAWDYGTQNGLIFFNRDKATSSESVRIYSGNAANSQPAAGDAFGQHAVFASHFRAFWPDGGGTDLTSYGNNLTMTGSPSVGGVAGPVTGSKATDYNGSTQYGTCAGATLTGSGDYSFFASDKPDSVTSGRNIVNIYQTSAIAAGISQSGTNLQSYVGSGGFSIATRGTMVTGSWQSAAGSHTTTSRFAYLNGTPGTEQTASKSPTGMTTIKVGTFASSGVIDFDGQLSLMGISESVLSAAWMAYWASMVTAGDQTGFYTFSGWTADSSGPSPAVIAAYYNRLRA